MADSSLSREHSLALLHKLSTDDGYRSRFEQKPAAALAEIGVPHDTIVNLNAACLASTTLADKSHFAQGHRDLVGAASDRCLSMIVPSVKMDFGSAS
ncbi:MAG: NHLP-related RiPP peptide [Rhodanobacteraceae bacterium]